MPGMGGTPHRAEPGADRGLVLAPFRGMRFSPDRVPDLAPVIAPPYDLIDPATAAALRTGDPHNVIQLILPRPARPADHPADDPGDSTDASTGAGTDDRAGYAYAATTLRRWISGGILVHDGEPGLYVYEQAPANPGAASADDPASQVQRGLIGAVGLRPAEERVIVPHEDVLPGPVADRLALMRATRANLEPILLTYQGGDAADVLDEAVRAAPLTTTRDGALIHTVWRITDPNQLAAIAADLRDRQALIADGHHRYAAYLELQRLHRHAGPGRGPWDFGLALLVDTRRYPLRVGAVHRVLPHLIATTAAQLLEPRFTVSRLDGTGTRAQLTDALARLDGTPRSRNAFVLAGSGKYWLAEARKPGLTDGAVPGDRPEQWRRLDPTVLQHLVLGTLWRVRDAPPDVTCHHDARAAVQFAEASGGTAVLLRATPEKVVRELAGAGVRMPRKSTSFAPKPRTGLVMRTLDAA
jgi:uncharacterized protein (DUF1015 family)